MPNRCEFVFEDTTFFTDLQQSFQHYSPPRMLYYSMRGVGGPRIVPNDDYRLAVHHEVMLDVRKGDRLCLLIGPEWSEFSDNHEVFITKQEDVVPCR